MQLELCLGKWKAGCEPVHLDTSTRESKKHQPHYSTG